MAETLLAAAKRLYSQHTANHPTIHCNRFPAWDELPKDEQNKWYRAAMGAAGSQQEERAVSMDGEPMGDPHPCDMTDAELDRTFSAPDTKEAARGTTGGSDAE